MEKSSFENHLQSSRIAKLAKRSEQRTKKCFFMSNIQILTQKYNMSFSLRPVFSLFWIIHTIWKVKFLSKNSIVTKPQHFHEFFTQIFFWQFFSWNQSCQEQQKSPKPQHFHEFFTQKNRQFSREIKVEFLDKKWRFRTVCNSYKNDVNKHDLPSLIGDDRSVSL